MPAAVLHVGGFFFFAAREREAARSRVREDSRSLAAASFYADLAAMRLAARARLSCFGFFRVLPDVPRLILPRLLR